MIDHTFVRQVLAAIKQQAEEYSKKFPPLHHILLLPNRQTIRIPNAGEANRGYRILPGGAILQPGGGGAYAIISHPAEVKASQQPSLPTVAFGKSQVSQYLLFPPATYWPTGLQPFGAVEVKSPPKFDGESGGSSALPTRVHLFFGDGTGFQSLQSLASQMLDHRKDIRTAMAGGMSSPQYGVDSYDPIFWSDAIEWNVLDAWLCTIHWWAWIKKDSPIHVRPKVMSSVGVLDAEHNDPAVFDRYSFSSIPANVFEITTATIDLMLKFLDLPRGPMVGMGPIGIHMQAEDIPLRRVYSAGRISTMPSPMHSTSTIRVPSGSKHLSASPLVKDESRPPIGERTLKESDEIEVAQEYPSTSSEEPSNAFTAGHVRLPDIRKFFQQKDEKWIDALEKRLDRWADKPGNTGEEPHQARQIRDVNRSGTFIRMWPANKVREIAAQMDAERGE